MELMANLHVIALGVAGLAALALGRAVGADLAFDDVAGVGPAVGALRIGLLLDHQLAVVPARLGRRLAGRAVLLHEAHLALALVVEFVVGPQILLALRRCQAGAGFPVALQEGEILVLLRLGWHDHRLGRVGLLVLVAGPVGTFVLVLARVLALGIGDALVVGSLEADALAVAAFDRRAGRRIGRHAHDHAVGAHDAGGAIAALARGLVGEA